MIKAIGAFMVVAMLLFPATSNADHVQIRRSCYPTYHAEHQRIVERVLVPYALPVEITKDYYFSIDSYYRDKLLVDAIVGRLKQENLPIPKEIDLSPPDSRNVPTTVPEGLESIVAKSCIKCHGKDNPGGRVDLSDLSTVPVGVRWQAHGLVNSGEMPKAVSALEDKAVLLFYEWAKTGSKTAALATKKGK